MPRVWFVFGLLVGSSSISTTIVAIDQQPAGIGTHTTLLKCAGFMQPSLPRINGLKVGSGTEVLNPAHPQRRSLESQCMQLHEENA